MGELRQHVREELADPDGVVIVDPSGFPKKGTESCGVDRQWCDRLAYATEAGYAPLDRRLYLPQQWADGESWGKPRR
jgi:SRSO17 transposase